MTAPHVGNTGVNDEDPESGRIWVSGYVVREPGRRPSSWRSQRTLGDELAAQGVVGISGIDTRALTRHLRERGAMRVGVSSADTDAAIVAASGCCAAPPMAGADLAGEVTTAEPYVVPATGREAVHRRGARPRHQGDDAAPDGRARHRGARAAADVDASTRCSPPARTACSSPTARRPGHRRPRGRPDRATCSAAGCRCSASASATRSSAGRSGLGTYKLRYGHRGINQPVQDRATGQGRGHRAQPRLRGRRARATGTFDTPFGAAEVSHVCLNDDVVEGLRCHDVPAFSVQYHPEAAAGPHDAAYLFDRFTRAARGRRADAAGAPTSAASWSSAPGRS